MMECKILRFSLGNADFQEVERLEGFKGVGEVYTFPKIEKFLGTYLNAGFTVKNMTGEGMNFSFYLERDV